MRTPQLRLSMEHELVVDQFAGGGGASLGIELALGRSPDIAINHDPEAIALHAANHPTTHHLCESVWDVDPVEVCGGRPVGLMWLSPDCKHFSKAKGGKPVEKKIRGLAWIANKWARTVKPRVIILENVEEFQDWGPLTADNMPCPRRKGQTFRNWKRQLENCGYVVEHRELRACDYGTPTIRKRLFVIARCDGLPISWPAPTHFDPKVESIRKRERGEHKRPTWRTAAACIDWSLACPSIFERERPLAENTLRRIAAGIKRYVVDAAKPFIVPVLHAGDARVYPIDEPVRTITGQQRGEQALVTPFVTAYHGIDGKSAARGSALDEPLKTQTCDPRFGLVAPVLVGAGGPAYSGKPVSVDQPFGVLTAENHRALIAPTLIQTGYGEREGQAPRAPGLDKPLGTIVAGGQKHALVAGFLARHNSNRDGSPKAGRPADMPLSTIVGSGGQQQLVAAHLAQHNTGMVGHHVEEPVSTIVGKGCTQAVVASHLTKLYGTNRDGQTVDAPMPTIRAGGTHVGEVRAFLLKYYGNERDGCELSDPMHTVTSKERFGLVTVDGEPYQIADIGMRMLAPRELYRAQGFPDEYRIDVEFNGKPLTKTAQVRMCGNSVCPPVAAAVIAANFSHEQALREVA
jgi:DNA (cytosine-5)-methyltransferase 1